jgi:hypothetical protein
MSPMPPERDPRGVRAYRYADASAAQALVDGAASLNSGNAVVKADGSYWHASLQAAGDDVDVILTPVPAESDESGQAPELSLGEVT